MTIDADMDRAQRHERLTEKLSQIDPNLCRAIQYLTHAGIPQTAIEDWDAIDLSRRSIGRHARGDCGCLRILEPIDWPEYGPADIQALIDRYGSPSALAAALDTTPTTVRKWASGSGVPKYENRLRIERLLTPDGEDGLPFRERLADALDDFEERVAEDHPPRPDGGLRNPWQEVEYND